MTEDARSHLDISAAKDTAGSAVYSGLLNQLLAEEEATKNSLEQRSLAIISSAGALIAILLGLVGLIYQTNQLAAPMLARWLLLFSVATFVIAGILGVLANNPMAYEVFGQDALDRMVEKQYWDGPPEIGTWRVARLRVRLIEKARKQNARKARYLRWAIRAGGFGVVLAGLSVISLLLSRPST
jgi:hypothetical protein